MLRGVAPGAGEQDRGLLLPAQSRARYRLERYPPPLDLAGQVAHLWLVEWKAGEQPWTSGVLPFPAVNLTLETALPSRITGVPTGRYDYPLQGRGRVLGARFRVGGFRPLLDGPVAALSGRQVPVEDVFPGCQADAVAAREAALPDQQALEELVGLLRRRLPLPGPDPRVDVVEQLVDVVAARPDVTRVEQLARCAHTSTRQLQRLFHDYVGVSPKWVLLRHRLHDATQAIGQGDSLDVAALAATLGYADQAHMTRDFRSVVGMTPAAYARRLRAGP